MHAKHNDIMITSDTVLKEIYLSLYLKGLCVRGSWTPNRTATYWPPLLWPSAFLSRSPGLFNRGPVAQPLWVLVFSTASSQQRVFLQTNWLPVFTELYNNSTPTFFVWASQVHSFNPSTVKVIFWYSLSRCTCYLHSCISCFDSPGESLVNIQHFEN